MIYDSIKNLPRYYSNLPGLSKAVKFIKNNGKNTPDGKYPIDNDKIFAIINSYTTKNILSVPFEAHKKYADLQYILEGAEKLDITHEKKLKTEKRYSKTRDIIFVKPPAIYSSVVLSRETFCVLMPDDYHRSGQYINTPENIKKIVIKITV